MWSPRTAVSVHVDHYSYPGCCTYPSTRTPLKLALRSDLMPCRGTRCGVGVSTDSEPCAPTTGVPCSITVNYRGREYRYRASSSGLIAAAVMALAGAGSFPAYRGR